MPPNALAVENRARAVNGRAVISSASCACCNGCPGWLHLIQCDTAFSCAPPPVDPPEMWICQTVTCEGGQPLAPGMVVLIAGVCWTVQDDDPVPFPPGTIYQGPPTVRCVEDCDDEQCPQGDWYYLTTPCLEGAVAYWVCGVTKCEVRGCHTVDPANERRRFQELPPGAEIRTLDQLGPPSINCCHCEPTCETHPLLDFDPQHPAFEGCYDSLPVNQTCCCTTNFPSQGRIRLTRWRTTQLRIDPVNQSRFDTFEMIAETIDSAGCPFYTIRVDRLTDGQPTIGFPFTYTASPPCNICGRWQPPILYRLARERVTFFTGIDSCHPFMNGPNGETTVINGWSNQVGCAGLTHDSAYYYTDNGGDRITTTFEVTAIMVNRGRCATPCGGGVVTSGVPFNFNSDDITDFLP